VADAAALTTLLAALARASAVLDRCTESRRARAADVRTRWQGGRRRRFDAAWSDLEAITRRVHADLRAARARVAARLDGR
jgi:hypothetical protein